MISNSRLVLAAFALAAAGIVLTVVHEGARDIAVERRMDALETKLDALAQDLARAQSRLDSDAATALSAAPKEAPRASNSSEFFRALQPELRAQLLAAIVEALPIAQRRGLTVIVGYGKGQAGQFKAAQEFVDLLKAADVRAKLGEDGGSGGAEIYWVKVHPKTAPAAKKILAALDPFLNAPAHWETGTLVKIGEVRLSFLSTPRFLSDGSLYYPPAIRVSANGLPAETD